MSVVSNVILSFSISEAQVDRDKRLSHYILADRIDQWLKENHYVGLGQNLEEWDKYGGQKHLETPIYVGAFNYLVPSAFANFVFSLPWEYPESVQLMIKGQEDEEFTVYSLCPKPGLHPKALEEECG